MPATEDNDDCYLAASGDECEENLIRGISDGERRCPTSRLQSNLHSKIQNLLHREQICQTGSNFFIQGEFFLDMEQIFQTWSRSFTPGANFNTGSRFLHGEQIMMKCSLFQSQNPQSSQSVLGRSMELKRFVFLSCFQCLGFVIALVILKQFFSVLSEFQKCDKVSKL